MLVYLITILLGHILLIQSFSNQVDNFDTEDIQNCICVPYWQCKDDFSGLIEDEIDVMDVRVLRSTSETVPHCTGDFDVCCKIECGKRRSVPDVTGRKFSASFDEEVLGFRILGADNDAEFGEFPWMLGVLKEKTYKCGASLIHPKVAITAAHCVSQEGPYKVRAGEWNWESNKEPLRHQDRDTSKVIIHPGYHPGSLKNDIAILIMDRSFKLAENVGVLCLPPQNIDINYKRCIATGWGKNSHKKGTYQSTLKKVELPLVPRPICLRTLQMARLGPMFNLHQSFICAGGEHHKDTCKGDGGSPLICPVNGEPERYEQIGIVSWGLTCGILNTPGVYVNVPMFNDWIDYQMKKNALDINIYRY